MSTTELKQLDRLIEISNEPDSPMTDWEKQFVWTIDRNWRTSNITHNQAEVFDRLVRKHLVGDDE